MAALKDIVGVFTFVCICITVTHATYNGPRNPKWASWGKWSACSKTCGGGEQQRVRVCLKPPYHPGRCYGNAKETRSCNVNACAAKIGFSAPALRIVPENIGSFKVKLSRSGATKRSHYVSVKSVDGSAKSPADFVRINPTKVTFGPNDYSKEITVTINEDKITEKTEYFKLVLSTSDKSVIITGAKFLVKIQDNDAKIGFSAPAQRTVPESIGSFKVKISRSGATKLSHDVSVKSVDGSARSPADFVRINPTKVTFGPNELSKEVTVTINEDKITEKTEYFKLVLSTSDSRVIITGPRFLVKIQDNDVYYG